MFGKSLLNSVKLTATNLVRADRGNVAAMFAIALVPLIGIIGTAVDYSRAVAARSAMQAALDTVALMVSKDAQADPTMTSAQATTAAQKYFNALYKEDGTSNVVITATYSQNSGMGSSVQVTGSALVATDIMRYAGYTDINIDTSSTTKWGATRMRIALVLDNTGSMADNNKMTNLKSAAKDLVTQLAGRAKVKGDIYISLVPFAKNVNLGSGFDKSYIKWSSPAGTSNPDTWDENNGTCSGGGYSTKSACTSAYVCSSTRYTTQRQCEANNKTWQNANYVWTPANHSKWSGCVMDRDQDNDISNVAPSPGDTNAVSTLFPAQEYYQGSTNYCNPSSSAYLQPVVPMTDPLDNSGAGLTKLTNAIGAMDPTGGTNQAIGTAWGWQSLSTTNGPIMAPAKDPNYAYQDYLVILSDGLNTQDRWPSYGNGQTQYTCNGQPCIDARQKKLCDAIKASGVTVFTIQVNINSVDPQSAILQDCATPPTSSLPKTAQVITQAGQTSTAFNTILAQITNLQISK